MKALGNLVCRVRGAWRRLWHKGEGRPLGCNARPSPGGARCDSCGTHFPLLAEVRPASKATTPPRTLSAVSHACVVCSKKARKVVELASGKRLAVCGAWCGQKVAKRGAA